MAAVDIQLAVDLLGIVIDCVFRNDKDLGNIPVAVAVAEAVFLRGLQLFPPRLRGAYADRH